jgi:putative endonuclease
MDAPSDMTAAPDDRPPISVDAPYYVYILECSDGSFYVGITNNLDRRVDAHNAGVASKYTRSRRPVTLRYRELCGTRSQALIRECGLRLLSRKEKQALVNGIK